MAQIPLNPDQVDRLKEMAKEIADQVQSFISKHSSVSVERTVLRLYGVDGVNSNDIPIPNRLVDILQEKDGLRSGVSRHFAAAMLASGKDVQTTAELIEQGKVEFGDISRFPDEDILQREKQLTKNAVEALDKTRKRKEDKQERLPLSQQPWRYMIVATGNIYEDCIQAKSAVMAGADMVAVIRSTAQSLLD
jgi:beta-lysine 5,6-aminomutase alpha subunit